MLNLARYIHSPDHSTKGTISHFDVLYVLVSTRFQVLFTPLPGFFSPFLHSTFLYRSPGSIRLGGWSPLLPTGFHVSGGTPDPAAVFRFRIQDFHFLWCAVPCTSANFQLTFAVLTPQILLLVVWPLPRSLATTCGISVDFFSSPYLDVSVQAVPHMQLCIHCMLTEYCSAGFPHSDIHGLTSAFD